MVDLDRYLTIGLKNLKDNPAYTRILKDEIDRLLKQGNPKTTIKSPQKQNKRKKKKLTFEPKLQIMLGIILGLIDENEKFDDELATITTSYDEVLGLLTHEFKNILRELIAYYLIGCEHEKDLRNFEELALNFYYDTEPDGFDALYELSERYGPDSDKGKIAREIIRKQKAEPESIDF